MPARLKEGRHLRHGPQGDSAVTETHRQLRVVRFGAFEADLQTGELRKEGVKLKFSGQPFQVLAILLERPGDVVTREELQKRLWPDTFVDVERNLNTAINKIRDVLGDSAESPQFVETLPRRGYRFIAPVEAIGNGPERSKNETSENTVSDAPPPRNKRPAGILVAVGACLLLAGAVWFASHKGAFQQFAVSRPALAHPFDLR